MATKSWGKFFRKSGYQGIYRREAKLLDVYKLEWSDDLNRYTPNLIDSKKFPTMKAAERYFMNPL